MGTEIQTFIEKIKQEGIEKGREEILPTCP